MNIDMVYVLTEIERGTRKSSPSAHRFEKCPSDFKSVVPSFILIKLIVYTYVISRPHSNMFFLFAEPRLYGQVCVDRVDRDYSVSNSIT